jgi:[protein-PII] uridylyltransferase
MGYSSGDGMLPVERFMRDYFRHANHIWQMARRREAALDAPSALGRMLDPLLGRKVEGDYRIGVRQISATRSGLAKLEGNLEEVLRLVELSVTEGRPLEHSTSSALLLAAPDCSENLTPSTAHRFMYLLGLPKLAGKSLRILHELGYLEKVIPPMKHARCLLQFNQYHKFTVDEHSLQAVERAAEFGLRDDLLGEVYRTVADKSRLHLALLLHDLGKGFEEDHSEVGRRIAVEMGERLQLSPAAADDVAMLVHQHLSMSHLAFRRDTGDPDVVRRFADLVGSPDRLRMLLALSCADLAAVGPDVLTQWKVEVLAELYRKTLAVLETGAAAGGDASDRRRQEILQRLSPQERDDDWYRRQVASLPGEFLATKPAEHALQALHRLQKLPHQGADAWGAYNAESATVEFTAGINSGRGRGAFASMAGALSSSGLQILAADAQIMADDLLLLRFTVLDPDSPGKPSAARLEKVAKAMVASASSTEAPRFRRIWGEENTAASLKLTALPNAVRIDNQTSADATVIEVFTFDRTGLLYTLARRLHELELTIWHAKIGTYIDQVVDVFYVTDRSGGKIEDPQQLEHVRTEMLAVIESAAV